MDVISYEIHISTPRRPTELFLPISILRVGSTPHTTYVARGFPAARVWEEVRVYALWDDLASAHGILCRETDLHESDYPPDLGEVTDLVARLRAARVGSVAECLARAAGLAFDTDDPVIATEVCLLTTGRIEPEMVRGAAQEWMVELGCHRRIRQWVEAGVSNPRDARILERWVRPNDLQRIIPAGTYPPIGDQSISWHLSAGTIGVEDALGWVLFSTDLESGLERVFQIVVNETAPRIPWDAIQTLIRARGGDPVEMSRLASRLYRLPTPDR